ncbi:hypothetical protein Acr_10g0010340 [Actinidia rufa]|uniref:Reverse transcriptase/retrotransposon-derived protein RNase H-like domain-containing protein n=1 Tax=Actinidia rufa TaxID=165716 RepID=A0A7J0FBS0_9ERIC|nr:hypothetical protein Acr_10g0010340 [Actinidia rufa]
MILNPSKCIFGVSLGKFLGFLVTKRGIEANPDRIQALLSMSSPKNIRKVQQLTGRVAALNKFVSKSDDKCLSFFKILRKNQVVQWNEESKVAFKQLKEYLGLPFLLTVPVAGASYFYDDRPTLETNSPATIKWSIKYLEKALLKWSIKLNEFDIDYKSIMAIKGQAWVNFVTEFKYDISPEPEEILPEVETPDEQNLDETSPDENCL